MRNRLLLFAGITILALPSLAAAQSPSCAWLEGVQPVSSHYVSLALARADQGIAFARNQPSDAEDFQKYLPSWAQTVDNGLRTMLDSHLRIVEQQRDLPDRTACLHLDQALLQCKAMDVTEEIHSLLQSGSWRGIWVLAQILPYVKERETQLLRGALSPRYHDRDWGIRKAFDPPEAAYGTIDETAAYLCGDSIIGSGEECDDGNSSSGDGCSEECRSEICPFNSDYAEYSLMGGCSAEILGQGNRLRFPPAAAEYESLLFLGQSFATFRQNAADLVGLQQQISLIANRDVPGVVPTPLPEPQHIAGCVAGRGVCTNLPSLSCMEDNDCLGVLGTCSITTLQNTAFWSPRHSLSVDRDHLRILSIFQELRRRQGAARRQRTDLRLPGERRDDGTLITERPLSPAETLMIPTRRAYYSWVSARQGEAEAALFASAAEPQRMIADALTSLRGSVADLAEIAGNRTGLRGLLVRFGYFLLRSCADRPCNMQLQQIIKIALTDECFPYTNGQYLKHTCSEPSWKVCADAVQGLGGLGIPFATNLPDPYCP